MEWERLNRDASKEILGKITHASDEKLFSERNSEASCAALPFYKNFLLYRVTNYATLPSFSLDFLGDGNTFYLLDGSPDPIFMVNNRGALKLNEANLLDYVDFFLRYVSTEDGDIYLIKDPDDLPFLDALSMEQQIALKQKFTPLTLDYNEVDDAYELHADIYYGGTLLKATMNIATNGIIEFSNQKMLTQFDNVETGGYQPSASDYREY
jgi:hypothetical protein